MGDSRARHHDGTIRDLLASDPVCAAIVVYLDAHPHAVDTARGIAEWWIHRDPRVTEAALATLAGHDLVQVHVAGTGPLYAYTRDRRRRRVVSDCVRALRGPREGPVESVR
jgi:hypothetical protein